MTSKARAEFDPTSFGVRIAVKRDYGHRSELLLWERPIVTEYDEEDRATEREESWLRLPEDDARAIYDALADHFGHAGHDTRALRRDYDAERGRVDKMLDAFIRGGPR